MEDFLTFRKMITPVIIRILFWIGVAAMIIGGFASLVAGHYLLGIMLMLLGPICVRIYCEILILFFIINDTLTDIRNLVRDATHGRPGSQV
ncbi:MAG: DUF4282 domain-containing protein [Planctomycetota bacterium]|nr:DUF4282 domain-containing protein [Planctomycetota bacterium]